MRQLTVRHHGICEYPDIYASMVEFNNRRDADTVDEIWCLQHEPVFTLGLAASREHLLQPGAIPVHEVDRGGQVTYHGPGQLVVYTLLDLRRKGITIKDYVRLLESSVINYLAARGIEGARRTGAPGVYVNRDKIAALGIRVRRGSCYHGIAINVDMNMKPFERINPCGYADLKVTQLSDLGVCHTVDNASKDYLPHLLGLLNYDEVEQIQTDATQQPVEAA